MVSPARLSFLEAVTNNNEELIHKNSEDISLLHSKIADLEENINLKSITINEMTNKLDEQIDRSMRETAIINGISGSETTWEETRNKLADTLSPLYHNNHLISIKKILLELTEVTVKQKT